MKFDFGGLKSLDLTGQNAVNTRIETFHGLDPEIRLKISPCHKSRLPISLDAPAKS
jgi:hypothetical protein